MVNVRPEGCSEYADQQLDGWVFDTNFFETPECPDLDEGGMAVFRITSGPQEKFIHIFNAHNGYYSHGFEFKAGETMIKSEYL